MLTARLPNRQCSVHSSHTCTIGIAEFAGLEFAGLENEELENYGLKMTDWKMTE